MKNLLIYLLVLFLFSQCRTVNLIQEVTTKKDQESVADVETLKQAGLKIHNKYVMVSTLQSLPELKQYDDTIHTSTLELMNNLGGVEVVEKRDFSQLKKEKYYVTQSAYKSTKVNQEAQFTEETVDSKVLENLKEYSIYRVYTKFTKADYQITYNPPSTIQDKKTGEYKTSEPNWTIVVNSGITLFVVSPDNTVEYKGTLEGKYKTTVFYEPEPADAHVYMPRAIEYILEDFKPILQNYFKIDSYIIALKSDKKYAMVFGGKENHIHEDRIFDVLDPEDATKEPIGSIKIFQVTKTDSWGSLSGNLDKIKVGSKVRIRPQSYSIIHKAWRWIESNFGL